MLGGHKWKKTHVLFLVNLHRWRKPEHLNNEDYWLYFLNEASRWKTLPTDAQIPQLQEAMSVLEDFSDKKESFLVYQTRLAAYTSEISVEAEREEVFAENRRLKKEAKQAEQKLKLAEKKAKNQAKQAKQAEQEVKQRLVVGLLKTTDMDIEQIATLSHLSVEQVAQIAKAQR